jgi:hypothetical protein
MFDRTVEIHNSVKLCDIPTTSNLNQSKSKITSVFSLTKIPINYTLLLRISCNIKKKRRKKKKVNIHYLLSKFEE